MKNKKQTKKVSFQSAVLGYLAQTVKLLSEKPGKTISAEQFPIKPADTRFIDCGDGTIKDTKLGLMWPKEGSAKTMTHEEAEKYCKEFSAGGHKDWRLPTVEELESLVDRTKYSPAIISNLFSVKTDDWYWTSTIYAGYSGSAWVVSFGYGNVDWFGRSNGNYVRPVRQY